MSQNAKKEHSVSIFGHNCKQLTNKISTYRDILIARHYTVLNKFKAYIIQFSLYFSKSRNEILRTLGQFFMFEFWKN